MKGSNIPFSDRILTASNSSNAFSNLDKFALNWQLLGLGEKISSNSAFAQNSLQLKRRKGHKHECSLRA